MASNSALTRLDLECPDPELQELLGRLICCTDCGFEFELRENHDLVIINKTVEYKVNLSKYLDNVQIKKFEIKGDRLVIVQTDNSIYEVSLADLISKSVYFTNFTTSGTGLQTEIIFYHNLGKIPEQYFFEVLSKDAAGYDNITSYIDRFIIWYETAPPTGQNNLKYSCLVNKV